MRSNHPRAGLTLGAIAALCAATGGALADDLRSTQVLVESGIFMAHAETDAAFARLDAPQPTADQLAPKPTIYFEQGSVGFGQADGDRRIGSSGSATQMRLGFERGWNGAIVGAMTSTGIGSVGSGDLGGRSLGQHVDVYGRFDNGALFAKLLFGGSFYDLSGVDRGPDDGKSRGSARAFGGRSAAQFGAKMTLGEVTVTPTFGLAAYANRLGGIDECGGADPLSFGARSARAAIGSFRVSGQRSFDIGSMRKLDVRAFVGDEEVLAYDASRAVATDASGVRQRLARESAPTGRGFVGGLGLGTSLAPGVSMTVDYDYGYRDSVATHSSRAKLGVSF